MQTWLSRPARRAISWPDHRDHERIGAARDEHRREDQRVGRALVGREPELQEEQLHEALGLHVAGLARDVEERARGLVERVGGLDDSAVVAADRRQHVVVRQVLEREQAADARRGEGWWDAQRTRHGSLA